MKLLFRMLLGMLMLTTVQAAWAQEPQAIGSIRYSEELGAYEIKSTDNLNDLAVYVNGIGTYSTGESEHENHTCMGQVSDNFQDLQVFHLE